MTGTQTLPQPQLADALSAPFLLPPPSGDSPTIMRKLSYVVAFFAVLGTMILVRLVALSRRRRSFLAVTQATLFRLEHPLRPASRLVCFPLPLQLQLLETLLTRAALLGLS